MSLASVRFMHGVWHVPTTGHSQLRSAANSRVSDASYILPSTSYIIHPPHSLIYYSLLLIYYSFTTIYSSFTHSLIHHISPYSPWIHHKSPQTTNNPRSSQTTPSVSTHKLHPLCMRVSGHQMEPLRGLVTKFSPVRASGRRCILRTYPVAGPDPTTWNCHHSHRPTTR